MRNTVGFGRSMARGTNAKKKLLLSMPRRQLYNIIYIISRPRRHLRSYCPNGEKKLVREGLNVLLYVCYEKSKGFIR